MFWMLLLTTSIVAVENANAQTAVAMPHSVQQDTSAIAMTMDAKTTAIMAVLQKITACNAKSKFYRPGTAGADASGCVTPPAPPATPVDPSLAAILKCNLSQKFYRPTATGADASGCVASPAGPVDPNLNAVLKCNAAQKFYDPLDASADSKGCVSTPDAAYYFASCSRDVTIGIIVPDSVLTPAGAWPSGFSANYSVVQSAGDIPRGRYKAMGYCKAGGATLWRKVDD